MAGGIWVVNDLLQIIGGICELADLVTTVVGKKSEIEAEYPLSIIAIRSRATGPALAALDGWTWTTVRNAPDMTIFADDGIKDGSDLAGIWEATPGALRISTSTWTEFHLIEGQLTITPDDGSAVTYVPGDSFTLEPGFNGLWETEVRVQLAFSLTFL